MPTYQYACTECGDSFEAVQSFSDDALTECPACSGRLRKVFSSVGIVFKGSGFYRNDSREAAKSATVSSDQNGADKSDKGDKPADKKEKAGATAADSGTKTSESPVKNPPAAKTASTSGKPASSGSTSSSTAGSAA